MVTMVAIKHAAMEERLHMGPKEMVSMKEDKGSVRGAALSNNLYSSAGGDPMPIARCREGRQSFLSSLLLN